MSPDKKEELLAGVMMLLIFIVSLFLIASMSGCAHHIQTKPKTSSIEQAAAISDRIDSKAVVIAEWLKTH